MRDLPQVLCIGSVLWDIIGRAPDDMERGSDVAGRISRLPGGVAMNIAMALNAQGLRAAILTSVGQDPEGRELMDAAAKMGLDTRFVHVSDDLPTDRYMAVEGGNGLIAAIADAHSLEAAGDAILDPLRDGRLADPGRKWHGMVALDGNLTSDMLRQVANSDMFDVADLRIAPASPGKAQRLMAFLGHKQATVYLNLGEANTLSGGAFDNSQDAAAALLETGLHRVAITNGAKAACIASANLCVHAIPPAVQVKRVTGAGDVFMATHMAAEVDGLAGAAALDHALAFTANYISSEAPL